MIFVTVGTHEQQFNRLIAAVDRLKEKSIIKDDVFIQTGYSDYIPRHCEYKNIISFEEMSNYMRQASIVITHGGPASFMQVISLGKKPIVVPRQLIYEEHVNNHQLEFTRQVLKKGYEIDVIDDIAFLKDAIKNNQQQCVTNASNNEKFNRQFSNLVNNLIGEER